MVAQIMPRELPRHPSAPSRHEAFCIEAEAVRIAVRARRGRTARIVLDDVSLSIRPGELVAIAGGSGAGKTMLLNALAGVQAPTAGTVSYNGHDLYQRLDVFREALGYVPQDDIVHRELTVERTLHYAARLRLPGDTPSHERRRIVQEVLAALGLQVQAGQRVGSLSGGQRKRVSIGVELLTSPGAFFLDEPTSGLDPATGRELLRLLRRLADAGSTVVLTTHAPEDISLCDRVVFLAGGGRLAFDGAPHEALSFFEVTGFEEIYEQVAEAPLVERAAWSRGAAGDLPIISDAAEPDTEPRPAPLPLSTAGRRAPGAVRQWATLSLRTCETLIRNPLTLAILAGSPVLVIAMMAVLFRPGAFDVDSPSPGAAIMITYWVAFGAFFFGLTYGLLMICTELPVFHRERLVNMRVAPYVLAKLTVLLPVLIGVVALMLCVLRLFDRLPAGGLDLYSPLALTLVIEGTAAITLGLLASAAVSRPEQATLALPMICFPQVLFSGAILPVPVMARAGQAISWFMTDRWAFESLGASLDLNDLFAGDRTAQGASLLAQYGDSFARPVSTGDLMMAASAAVCLALTCWVLGRKRPGR